MQKIILSRFVFAKLQKLAAAKNMTVDEFLAELVNAKLANV